VASFTRAEKVVILSVRVLIFVDAALNPR